MATAQPTVRPMGYTSDSESSDGQSTGGRKLTNNLNMNPSPNPNPNVNLPPSSSHLNRPAGNIIKGAVDDNGKLKDAALLIGIKLDLEAEIHLTARIRGDITIGLY